MKDNILAAKWSKREKDIVIYYPRKCDGALLFSVLGGYRYSGLDKNRQPTFGMTFLEELKDRGYDLSTLKFSIKKLDDNKVEEDSVEDNK